jgi:hypothetical protein
MDLSTVLFHHLSSKAILKRNAFEAATPEDHSAWMSCQNELAAALSDSNWPPKSAALHAIKLIRSQWHDLGIGSIKFNSSMLEIRVHDGSGLVFSGASCLVYSDVPDDGSELAFIDAELQDDGGILFFHMMTDICDVFVLAERCKYDAEGSNNL